MTAARHDREVAAILDACREHGISVETDGDEITMIFPGGMGADIRRAFTEALLDRRERIVNFILAETGRAGKIQWTN